MAIKLYAILPLLALFFFDRSSASMAIGSCPKVKTFPNFEPYKFMGRWYEVRSLRSKFEPRCKCTQADYKMIDSSTIVINGTSILLKKGTRESLNAVARIIDPADAAKMKITVDGVNVGFDLHILVLGTDYENYAVLFNCVKVAFMHIKHAWIVTRYRNPHPSIIDEAKAVVNQNHLRWSSFSVKDQSDCD